MNSREFQRHPWKSMSGLSESLWAFCSQNHWLFILEMNQGLYTFSFRWENVGSSFGPLGHTGVSPNHGTRDSPSENNNFEMKDLVMRYWGNWGLVKSTSFLRPMQVWKPRWLTPKIQRNTQTSQSSFSSVHLTSMPTSSKVGLQSTMTHSLPQWLFHAWAWQC